MEKDAIITAVQLATTRSLGAGIEIDPLHVTFRVVRRSMYDDQIKKAISKSPPGLTSFSLRLRANGYLMEQGQFTVELVKDDRIKQDLGVVVEVIGI